MADETRQNGSETAADYTAADDYGLLRRGTAERPYALVRNERVERTLTVANAERGDEMAALALSDFAEDRALPGNVDLCCGRSLIAETNEELADARNYLVWKLRSDPGMDPATKQRVTTALRHVIAAWRDLGAIR